MLLDSLAVPRSLSRLATPVLVAFALAGCTTLSDQPDPAAPALQLEPSVSLSPNARTSSFLDQAQFWSGPEAQSVYAFEELDGVFEHLVTRFSSDGGRSWGAPLRPSPETEQEARHHVFWIDRLPDGALGMLWWRRNMVSGQKAIYLSRSSDDGRSWSEQPPQVNGASHAFLPSIATAADGRVLISWLDERSTTQSPRSRGKVYKHYFSLSSDSGQSWPLHDRELPGNQQTSLLLSPESVISGPVLMAIYFVADSGGYALEAHRSEDGGAHWTWVSITRDPYRSIFAEFAFLSRSERPAFVFCQGKNRDAQLVLASSGDRGQSWQTKVLTESSDIAYHVPALARSAQGLLALVWEQNLREAWVPMVSFSSDEGASWSAPRQVPLEARRETDFRTYPQAAFDSGGALLVTWMDRVERRQNVYLNRSADRGQTWLSEPALINAGSAAAPDAWLPQLLTLADGSGFVFWQERDPTGTGPLLLRRFTIQQQ